MPELLARLPTKFDALHVGGVLVRQFLPPCLHREILLGLRDRRFTRIAILRDQVTGEAREVVVVDLALAARSNGDHFAGAGKMVLHIVSRLRARRHCPPDGILEPSPLAVTKQRREVARAPVACAMFVSALECFESGSVDS